jgi:hypothetical protein
MDITALEVAGREDGTSRLTVWVKCDTAQEIDDIITWLALAKSVMIDWKGLRAPPKETEL